MDQCRLKGTLTADFSRPIDFAGSKASLHDGADFFFLVGDERHEVFVHRGAEAPFVLLGRNNGRVLVRDCLLHERFQLLFKRVLLDVVYYSHANGAL